jgi:hypothetical protein
MSRMIWMTNLSPISRLARHPTAKKLLIIGVQWAAILVLVALALSFEWFPVRPAF